EDDAGYAHDCTRNPAGLRAMAILPRKRHDDSRDDATAAPRRERFSRSHSLTGGVVNRRSALAAIAGALVCPRLVHAATVNYALREDVQAFIESMRGTYGFDRDALKTLFGQARYNETAERLTTPGQAPPSNRNWTEYRVRALDETRLREGVLFWNAN